MAESKHTPGPWTVDGPAHKQIVWSGPEQRVCFLAHSDGADTARDIANGRLIAAAPDMLEALKRIAQPHGCGCVPCTGQCTSQESLQIAVDVMREIASAAIAKAEAR